MHIKHLPEQKRFVANLDAGEAVFTYQVPKEGVWLCDHTYVPQSLNGRGVGSKLVKHALDVACENDIKIIPQCSFVAAFIDKNPAYQSQLA